MPRKIGDIGFPIVLDPKIRNRLGCFPMDGSNGVAAHGDPTASRRST